MKTGSLVIAFKMSLRRNLKTRNLETNALFALAAFALLSVASTTRALAGYPDRIIRIVVPFPPGGVNEGLVMVARPPAELDRYFRGEEARWHKLIQDAGIKVE